MDDWKKYTDYRGYTENDEVVQWFWKVSSNPSGHSTIVNPVFAVRTVLG